MVRTLSSPLTTALASLTRRPSIQITAQDHILHYSSYQTPGTADAWNDACVAADGSIIRVRLTRGGSTFQQSFQYQRITDPSVAGQWSTWTTFGSGAGLAVWHSSGYTVIYSDGYSLKSATCDDAGGTWLTGQDVAPATSTAIGRISPRLFFDASALGGLGLMNLVCVEQDSGL